MAKKTLKKLLVGFLDQPVEATPQNATGTTNRSFEDDIYHFNDLRHEFNKETQDVLKDVQTEPKVPVQCTDTTQSCEVVSGNIYIPKVYKGGELAVIKTRSLIKKPVVTKARCVFAYTDKTKTLSDD
jgi:hypothetical protein